MRAATAALWILIIAIIVFAILSFVNFDEEEIDQVELDSEFRGLDLGLLEDTRVLEQRAYDVLISRLIPPPREVWSARYAYSPTPQQFPMIAPTPTISSDAVAEIPVPQATPEPVAPAPEPQPVEQAPQETYYGDWRDAVCSYPWSCSEALYIIERESGGNPEAWNPSGACGLFQLLPCPGYDLYTQLEGAYAKWLDGGGSFQRHWYNHW